MYKRQCEHRAGQEHCRVEGKNVTFKFPINQSAISGYLQARILVLENRNSQAAEIPLTPSVRRMTSRALPARPCETVNYEAGHGALAGREGNDDQDKSQTEEKQETGSGSGRNSHIYEKMQTISQTTEI